MSFNNSIIKKYNRGFSLVEIMMVVGMLGGLSLVVMNMTKQSGKSSAKYDFDSDKTQITNEITGILSNSASCLTALGGINAVDSTTTPVTSIGTQYYSLVSTTPAPPANGYGNAGIKIASYALSATPAEVTANTSWLLINFQGKDILGTQGIKTNRIKLNVTVNGSNLITACNAVASGSGTNGLSGATAGANCTTLGAQAFDSVTGAPLYCNNDSPQKHWTALGGGIKAWVRFNGDGTSACAGNVNCPISGSFNISHVYHYLPSRGVYQIFFATPQPNVNYVVTGATSHTGAGNCAAHIVIDSDAMGTSYTRTTSYFFVSGVNDQSGACWARDIELQVVGY